MAIVDRSFAWVVLVPMDDSLESAILSGKSFKSTGTEGSVVALASWNVSRENIRSLNSIFDLVVIHDTEEISNEVGFGHETEQDLLLVSAMRLSVFSKVIVSKAGVIPLHQLDHMFEDDLEDNKSNGNCLLMMGKEGLDWKVARIIPDAKQFWKLGKKKNGCGLLGLFFKQGKKVTKYCPEVSSIADLGKFADKEMVFVENATAEQILVGVESQVEIRAPLKLKEDTGDWVAIVGMACRFPQANSLQEYWDILENGRNTCSTPPDNRTCLVDMDQEIIANFLKSPIDQFDAGFFGISPSEAGFTDPQARLLLEVSWEAFEEAGINPEKMKGTKSGVFYGSWLQEYREALTEALSDSSTSQDFFRKYLGNGFGCSAAKLSYFYGFTGPNIATESGCSSSMIAVDMAVKSLQRKEIPMALACGSNLILYMTKHQKIWAEDGRSKTFDAGADGYARAEGIAVLILKRYEDAMRDGDNIHGIIRGSASSQEGLSKSFGTPTVESEYSAMRDALRSANVDPSQVDYVEAHATGTSVGDPIEAAAIVKAYSSEKSRSEPLWIGSGKTNMGHSESCSGLAGIIKVVLAMKHEIIPKHLNVTSVNPQVDFSPIPGEIPLNAVSWTRKAEQPRMAGVSSFGITGTDAHVIIQEPPKQNTVPPTSGEGDVTSTEASHLLTLSAKSEAALEQLAEHFRVHLESRSDSIQDLTFTANACRPHHPFRKAVVGQTKQEMIAKLVAGGDQTANNARASGGGNRICFTFPGKIGNIDMAPFRTLYETVPYFKDTMDDCDSIFKTVTGSESSLIGPLRSSEEIQTDKNSKWYFLLPTCQYSLAKLWMYWGIKPHAVLGHCFGEISARLISGGLKLQDFYKHLHIVPGFFQCQKEVPAAVMAIQSNRPSVDKLIAQFLANNNSTKKNDEDEDPYASWIDVTSVNSHDQTVVAGPPVIVQAFRDFLKAMAIRCKIVSMEICAHSRAVEPGYIMAMEELNKITFHPLSIPYVSSATGKLIGEGELNSMYVYKVFRNCVNFTDACSTAQERISSDLFLEMSCNNALTKFTKDNLPDATCVASFRQNDTILNSLAELYSFGAIVNWDNFYENGKQERVPLPHYPFQRKSCWFDRKLKDCQDFKMTQGTRGKVVHPVLGIRMESPACMSNIVMFQNDWFDGILSDKKTQFIGDHLIGSKVVFPGAGFMEMILSAWKLANNGEENFDSGMSVKNFKIHAPLLVEENAGKRTQVAVNTESKMVSIYAGNHGFPWRLHASGEIGSVGAEDVSKMSGYQVDKNMRMESSDEIYAAAQSVGLSFGPEFKSIQGIHRDEESGDVVTELKLPENLAASQKDGSFVCHPILIDAMIQGVLAYKIPKMKRLHVPVQVGNFSVVPGAFQNSIGDDNNERHPNGEKWYVHCKSASGQVSLLDHNGTRVGLMEGLELVATSPESVLRSAQGDRAHGGRQAKHPVNYYDICWKRSNLYQSGKCVLGTSDNAQDTKHHQQSASERLHEIEAELWKFNHFSEEEAELDRIMNRLCYLYVVKALFELGWTPEMGRDLVADDVKWGIVPGLVPAFKHFLSYLDHGPVEALTLKQVEKEIDDILQTACVREYVAMETIRECGSNLSGILRGIVPPHKILFGDKNLADHYYKTSRLLTFIPHLENFFKHLVSIESEGGRVLRILEVGAGTGAFPNKMVPVLNAMGVSYEYHFTDISPTLVSKAKELFSEEDKKKFVFKTLNLEMDPLAQGFPPGYYDLVIAFDVLHATRDLNKTLDHIAMVTSVGGRVFLGETERPVREVDICFGILEGYWLFEDGIRQGHCTVDSQTWLDLLASHGFRGDPLSLLFCEGQMSMIFATKTSDELLSTSTISKDWIVFTYGDRDLNDLRRGMEGNTAMRRVTQVTLGPELVGGDLEQVIRCQLENVKGSLEGIVLWMIYDDRLESRPVLEPLLLVSQYLIQAKMKVMPRLCVVTQGSWAISDKEELLEQCSFSGTAWGFMRNVRMEMLGIASKCVDLERGTGGDEVVREIMSELWVDDKEAEVVYRDGVRYVRRMKDAVDPAVKELSIPEEGEYRVQLPVSKVLKDVRFVGAGDEPGQLGVNKVKVEVRCVSLNFKDVLAVMKPSKDFEDIQSIGLDFAGVVSEVGEAVTRWRVGDAVFGCGEEMGSMRSHLKIDEKMLMALPENMSFEEAATLPAVFLTAWYCMVNVGELRKGQTLLVHAASGGVGLAAIQIAKMLGVRVIGTAGSEKKRRFLRSQGVEHVFNSRTLDFGEEVKEVTRGQGVDMVLNCLTGPGFKEASLNVCRDGGHFVEISKLDIWTVEEVQSKRPLVKYDIIDVSELDSDMVTSINDKLSEFLETGAIKALPRKTFPACRLAEALAYLQKAKQIGKVIINMPQSSDGERRDLLFNARSTYLITGGKGAIGFAVCKWMIRQGARYVVLLGRSEASDKVKQEICGLEEDYGAVVICRELDISDYGQVQQLICEISLDKHLPPLRGVHHCAGILADRMIAHQDWANFQELFKTKVDGAWNLHRSTLGMSLDDFVLYGSASATFGIVGQVNYVAGNAFMDHLSMYRHSYNLPSISVNWGHWKAGLAEHVHLDYMVPYSVHEGICALEGIMRDYSHERSNLTAGIFCFENILKIAPHYKNTLFETLALESGSKGGKKESSSPMSSDDKHVSLVDDLKNVKDPGQRMDLVRKFVLKVLCETLGADEQDVRGDVEFSDMGIDSLMSIEFTNKIYSGLQSHTGGDGGGTSQEFIDLEENGTLNKMTALIASSLEQPAVK